jgi:hypothetical protein
VQDATKETDDLYRRVMANGVQPTKKISGDWVPGGWRWRLDHGFQAGCGGAWHGRWWRNIEIVAIHEQRHAGAFVAENRDRPRGRHCPDIDWFNNRRILDTRSRQCAWRTRRWRTPRRDQATALNGATVMQGLSRASTHSRVANSTASSERHGPRRRISSVLNKPWTVSASAFEPIGNMPPAEAEERYYAQLEEVALAA